MNEDFRLMVINHLQRGEELPVEWARELFPPDKREYELVYHGKEREEDILAETMAVPLQRVSTFGKNGNGWHNKLIFGDNLQVLKTLVEKKKAGELCNEDGTPGVRLIYIDPPFATKQDFRGTKDQKAYQDKIAGAEFIEFTRKRLILLRELLSDDGSIYLHLDQKKSHYMKIIADEIFGESRFLNEIVWQRTNAHNETSQYGRIHDVILFYSRSAKYVWNPQRVAFSEAQTKRYREDTEGRLYTTQDLTAERRNSSSGKFNWRGTMPSEGRGWGYKIEQLEEWWEQGLIATRQDGTPRMDGLIVYMDEQEGQTPQSIWSDVPRIANTSGERVDYPTQKPEALLARIVSTSSNPGDIVLDAFAGAGTTCAVAEKLGRRWIGIDVGKLAIYTMQKRMLNLRSEIGNKGKALKAKPFTLYNAGLYDFSSLRQLPWSDWRFFALELFGCKSEPHVVGGLQLDGKLKGASVLVFNFHERPGQRIDRETVEQIHAAVGQKVGRKFFIIAPRGAFDFQQDYIDLDGVRYYAMRIPYSIINELHSREFTALEQPKDEKAVNETVDSVGFDFIQPPQVQWKVGIDALAGSLLNEAYLKISGFKSRVRLRNEDVYGDLETLSTVMLDFDFDGDVFDLDAVFYGDQLKKKEWEARFPYEGLGEKIMVVFLDIHGNEAREVIPREAFGKPKPLASPARKKGAKRDAR
jgi:DNA modification methylase